MTHPIRPALSILRELIEDLEFTIEEGEPMSRDVKDRIWAVRKWLDHNHPEPRKGEPAGM